MQSMHHPNRSSSQHLQTPNSSLLRDQLPPTEKSEDMHALVPATEGQSPSLSFNGNFATLSSYFHRDSSVTGRTGSDQTSFEEDMDTAVRDHRSYVLSSCKFSDDSHIVIGDVKTSASTMQQMSSNSKYRFEKTEFKDRTKVISGDMDDKAYQACVNNRSAV